MPTGHALLNKQDPRGQRRGHTSHPHETRVYRGADTVQAMAELSPLAEAVYHELLKTAPVLERDFLARSAEPGRARRWLSSFLETGLVREDGDGLLHVHPPRAALETWAAAKELEAARARKSAEALSRLYASVHGAGSAFVETVEGKLAARELFRMLLASARDEMRGLERGPYLRDTAPAPERAQVEGMRRGLPCRAVYDTGVLHDEGLLSAVRQSVEAGEQARVLPDVPMKLLMSDRDRALIILPRDDGVEADALLVYPSKLLDVLSDLFEVFWRLAAPIATGSSPQDGAPADSDRLLALLTAGLTDEAIARDLGISERTVHRRVSRLQELLGARTRFQLGVQASRRGWL
jgi:DNA-binding CsgD family transcriptional regulator